ncbi:MAG: hypothetical protein D6830_06925 [Ignavibacteria bacterium]|nr:MAG: hypothetical protein D6830_06925 [Ignavibacteria bacterium]
MSKERIDQILIIVPTNRKLRKLKKQLIDSVPGKSVSGINMETITTLTGKLLSVSHGFSDLSEFTAVVLLEEITKKNDFEYFASYKNAIPFGTLIALKDVLSEYKRSGISPSMLMEEAQKLSGAEKKKAKDIANIYQQFVHKCNELKSYDVGDIYSGVLSLEDESFIQSFKKIYEQVECVVAFGFDEFSSPEVAIFDRISGIVSDNLFIHFDYYDYNSFIFDHLNKSYDRLIAKGFRRIKDISPDESNRFLIHLRKNLFKRKIKKNSDFKDSIFLIDAPTRRKEVEYIAKEVKQLLSSGKAEPHEICIAFNLIGGYRDLVKYQFELAGIPVNITDRINLDQTSPIAAIINLWEIQNEDYYYKDIIRASVNGFLTFKEIHITDLMNVSRALKITGGKNNWKSKIAYELENSFNDEVFKISRDSLQKARKTIETFESLLAPFEKPLTHSEFINETKALIEKTGLVENIINKSSDNIESNVKAITVFIESMEEVFSLLSRNEGNIRHNFNYYLEKVKTLSKAARFNVKEKSDYGILVTNVEEIRGLKFKYLFIGGMIDKEFPLTYSPEIFVSGDYIKGERNHLTEQRYKFYRALSTWKNGLYFSYPERNDKNEFVKSSFLDDFEKAFDVTKIGNEKFENIIISKYEAQKHFEHLADDELKDIVSKSDFCDYDFLLKLREINGKKSNGVIIPEFNGLLLSNEIEKENNLSQKFIELLDEFKNNIYSVSQLETYAKCPFKFFIERILNVEVYEEPTEDIAAREFGGIIHEILFEFYSKIDEQNLVLSNCSDEVFNKSVELIFEIAQEKLDKPQFDDAGAFYEKEKLLGLRGNKEDSILYKFLEEERKDSDFTPKLFEYQFGMKDDFGVISEPITIGDIKLRGKIDRIEIDKDHRNFNIVDYKMGNPDSYKKNIEEGLSLQLPIYAYAIENDLEMNPHELIIYSLKYDKKKFGRKVVVEPGNVKETINNSIEFVKEYVDKISQGYFPLSQLPDREKKVCVYCKLSSLCRVKENNL